MSFKFRSSGSQKRLLWLDDATSHSLARTVGLLRNSGIYELDVAVNANDGISRMIETLPRPADPTSSSGDGGDTLPPSNGYDLVIFDVRIPIGDGRYWKPEAHQVGTGRSPLHDKPGIELLNFLLTEKIAERRYKSNSFDWLRSERILVYSVNGFYHVESHLKRLGIDEDQFLVKSSATSFPILRDTIDRVIARSLSISSKSNEANL